MDDSEEVILKGSALYEYLHQTGFTNFESYEVKEGNLPWFPPQKDNLHCMEITNPAPQWSLDHLNYILKCGLILEDHRHFIECYYPLQVQKCTSSRKKFLLYGAPFCVFGGLYKLAKISASRSFLFAGLGACSVFSILGAKETLQRRSASQALNQLALSLAGLEKVYIHFKKMFLLVHQNEFIMQNLSLPQQEMMELKRKLHGILLSAVHNLFSFLDEIKKVPLSIDVDSTFQSLSLEDIAELNQDDSYSLEDLKKLFNSYILLQSEFLRRLALCYCPDIWSHVTSRNILECSRKLLPEIVKWSVCTQQNLTQEQRFFRAVLKSKDKQSQLKSTSSGWDYSDVYVSVRSASIHMQSLLIQIQGLQDILENEEYAQSKNKRELLSTVDHILSEISKDFHSGQACIDACSVQIYKIMNTLQPPAKISEPEQLLVSLEDSDVASSTFNPPVQDEVFELLVCQDEILDSEEDERDVATVEYNAKKLKEGEASKKVLQELKTVLIKKAAEWKEREKRALEVKGIAYTAPEQVNENEGPQKVGEDGESTSNNLLDFLPTDCQNVWPLPRLKGNLQNHRSRVKKVKYSKVESSLRNDVLKSPTYNVNCAQDKENQTPRVGFGASLLAEAMAKSRSMQNSRKEDVFVDSDDDDVSRE